jgi:hypothetical protein
MATILEWILEALGIPSGETINSGMPTTGTPTNNENGGF